MEGIGFKISVLALSVKFFFWKKKLSDISVATLMTFSTEIFPKK